MIGCEPGDDGVPGRDGVTTLPSHQSGILHSLIFSFVGLISIVTVTEKSAVGINKEVNLRNQDVDEKQILSVEFSMFKTDANGHTFLLMDS